MLKVKKSGELSSKVEFLEERFGSQEKELSILREHDEAQQLDISALTTKVELLQKGNIKHRNIETDSSLFLSAIFWKKA